MAIFDKPALIVLVAAMALTLVFVSACMFVPPQEESYKPLRDSMTLVWADEFNTGSVPDTSVWSYQTGTGSSGWGNNEVQTYTSDAANAFVSDGTLKIQAIKTGSAWSSARIRSINNKDFTYGYMEIRAKLPGEAGSWPAIWMMPTKSVYGSWPASGEIDIMEAAPTTWGLDNVAGTVHREAGSGSNGYGFTHHVSGTSTGFHTYAVEWTTDYIRWFYDDEYLGTYRRNGGSGSAWWPFDQDFHFILNVAMGGNLGGAIDSSVTSATLEVDYVRVYQ